MKKNEVVLRLTEVFRMVFDNENLMLSENLTANDVENWDSLTHMVLISAIENKFDIKFKLKELNKLRNVGDLISIILTKQ